ncbi:MAG: hypothetical protein AAGJ28_00435 [Pseudomonadota bacterium]
MSEDFNPLSIGKQVAGVVTSSLDVIERYQEYSDARQKRKLRKSVLGCLKGLGHIIGARTDILLAVEAGEREPSALHNPADKKFVVSNNIRVSVNHALRNSKKLRRLCATDLFRTFYPGLGECFLRLCYFIDEFFEPLNKMDDDQLFDFVLARRQEIKGLQNSCYKLHSVMSGEL